MRERASSLGVVLLLAIMALAASWLLQNNADVPQVDYAQARQLFVQEKVQRFTVRGNTLTLELREELKATKRQRIRDIMKHPEQEELLETQPTGNIEEF